MCLNYPVLIYVKLFVWQFQKKKLYVFGICLVYFLCYFFLPTIRPTKLDRRIGGGGKVLLGHTWTNLNEFEITLIQCLLMDRPADGCSLAQIYKHGERTKFCKGNITNPWNIWYNDRMYWMYWIDTIYWTYWMYCTYREHNSSCKIN